VSVCPGNPVVIQSLQAQALGLILTGAVLHTINSTSQFWSWVFAEVTCVDRVAESLGDRGRKTVI